LNIRERIALAIVELSKKGIKKNEIALKIGVSRSFVSEVANGNTKPSIEMIEGLGVHYSEIISKDWLLTGEGPMFRQQEADKPDQTPAPTEDSATLDPKMTAVIKTVQMMPLEKQQEFIAETQKRAESIKQFLEMQERIERLEKEKCA